MWRSQWARPGRSAWVAVLLLALSGCGRAAPDDADSPPVLGGHDCPELSCMACAQGQDCAERGPFLGDTCCALGDDVLALSQAESAEIVDFEVDDRYIVTCGGFGGRVVDAADPSKLIELGGIGGRCQRVAVWPVLGDGTRVYYLAHHGDSRSVFPYLYTYHLSPAGEIQWVGDITDESEDHVLFEGLAHASDTLYVAAHAGGVRIYSTDERGIPALVGVMDGFRNAVKIAIADGVAYVSDESSLHLLSLVEPLAPVRLAELQVTGRPRDIEVAGDRVFLAMGSTGVLEIDVSNPSQPVVVGTLATEGSAQSVAFHDGRLAVAAWTHVALYQDGELLAREVVRGPLEQDVAVAFLGDTLVAGEWGTGVHTLRYRPGYVAPDLVTDEPVLSFRGDRVESVAVIVRNRGLVGLRADVSVARPDVFESSAQHLEIAPGAADVFEVTYRGESFQDDSTLTLASNDPDRSWLDLPLRVHRGDEIRIGDKLDDRFGFLDPLGTGTVENLDGQVLVLAYFGVW